jgi:hypothetical protein
MSSVSLYVVDLKRVQPFMMAASRVTTVVHTGSKDLPKSSDENFKPGQVMRRSFVKDQNGVRASPDVKVSEEQSDKSGTDPEDSEENFSQADITDYQNYEQIFRPRIRELNRTPTQDDLEDEFQAPDNSEPESLPTIPSIPNSAAVTTTPTEMPAPPPPVVVMQRPAHLKVSKSSKKPSPSPTRRASQPAPPPQAYSGSPVRVRKGSQPTTPTSAGIRPVYELPTSPTRYYRPPTSPMLSSRRQRSSSVQSRFIAVSASYPIFEFRFLV